MIAQVVAFLAVATSVAFANSCGYCYPGYGSGYVNTIPAYAAGSGFRVLNGCSATLVSPRITATPTIVSAVGGPEVVSSCETAPVLSSGLNYYGSGIYGSGVYGYGSALGGYRTGLVAAY